AIGGLTEIERGSGCVEGLSPTLQDTGDGSTPCSPGQKALLALSRLRPDDPVLNLPVCLRLTGPLDTALLERCLGEIVRRHGALRTRFEWTGSEPVQMIAEAQSPSIVLLGPRHSPVTERGDVQRLMREQARQPFGL